MSRSRTVLWVVGVAASAALGVAGVAASQGANTVEQRQTAMKQVGQEMKKVAVFSSAGVPFDGAAVKSSMTTIAFEAKKLQHLYPPESAADPKTAADPKIWKNMPDFDKRLTEMASLAEAAGKTYSTDSFKPAFSALGATCKSCHDIYRKKKTA